MELRIGSSSQGGTGYLTRIIQAAQDSNHVEIVINEGIYQDNVYSKVKYQLDLLHNVVDVHFTHTVRKA